MSEAFIFDSVRTPRGTGKSRGSLYTVRPTELLAITLRALAERNRLPTEQVEDVVMGCVTQTGEQGSCIARFAALEAGWDYRAPAVTLNRFCGSGLEAINQAAAMVAAGFAELVVAGGVESMSRVKMGSDGGMIFDPAMQWKVGTVPQGISADLLATINGFTRAQVDEFALASQNKAQAALARGAFDRSLVPVRDGEITILEKDEYPRADTTLERLAQLKPAFEMVGTRFGLDALTRKVYPQLERIEHVHTAGNSSGIVDGAAAVLLGSRQKGESLGLEPRARVLAATTVGSEPLLMLDGPIPATKKALAQAKMSVKDLDLVEINEAFAAVPMVTMQTLEIDPERVNVNGGAIALGHPLGATGAMLLGTLLDELEARDRAVGLTTLCIGGGMGIATIIERV
jgi:acetyl-CoA C-acetyltransferase